MGRFHFCPNVPREWPFGQGKCPPSAPLVGPGATVVSLSALKCPIGGSNAK